MSSDLFRTQGIGPIAFRQLLLRFGSAGAALDAIPDLARCGGGRSPALFRRDAAEREMAQAEAAGARYLSIGQGLLSPAASTVTPGERSALISLSRWQG